MAERCAAMMADTDSGHNSSTAEPCIASPTTTLSVAGAGAALDPSSLMLPASGRNGPP